MTDDKEALLTAARRYRMERETPIFEQIEAHVEPAVRRSEACLRAPGGQRTKRRRLRQASGQNTNFINSSNSLAIGTAP